MEESMGTIMLAEMGKAPANTTAEYNLNDTEDTNSTDPSCNNLVFELALYGFAMGALCIVGFVGNTISFMVLQKDRSTPVASFLLQTLAIADNIFLLLWLVHYSIKSFLKFSEHEPSVPGYTAWVYIRVCTFPIMYMAQTQTIWQTVVIALNRFMAVCMPYRAPHLCNINNVYKEVFLVTLFAIAYNVPRFFELEITLVDNVTTWQRTSLGKSTMYSTIYTDALYYLFSFIIPLIILAFVNTRVIIVYKATQLRRKRLTSSARRNTENDNNITLVMIMVVLIFIVCQAPARIVQIIWGYDVDCQPYRFYIIHFTNTLEVLNSSINFLIYCVFHKRFRDIMRHHFCCGLLGSKGRRESARFTTTEGLSLEEVQRTTSSMKTKSSSTKSVSQEHNRNGSIPHAVCDKSTCTLRRTEPPEGAHGADRPASYQEQADPQDDSGDTGDLITDPILTGEDQNHALDASVINIVDESQGLLDTAHDLLEENGTEPKDDITEPLSP